MNNSIDIKALDLIFRRVSPIKILNDIKKSCNSGTMGKDILWPEFWSTEYFNQIAESTLSGYSEDEQSFVLEKIRQCGQLFYNSKCNVPSFIAALVRFSDDKLRPTGTYPVCKSEAVLIWRDACLKMGQDLFVCAYAAYHDFLNGYQRTDFTWPVVLHIDNAELYSILKQGYAENHNHLAGGTQSFPITWCCMMNYPERIETDLVGFTKKHPYNLFARSSRGNEGSLSAIQMLELAAEIRSILFRKLKSFSSRHPLNSKELFENEYLQSFSIKNDLCNTVDTLKFTYGAKVSLPDDDAFCLDYALEGYQFKYCENSDVRVMVGERSFLYRCFKACLDSNKFSLFDQKLFYLYLVLQCSFRSEMIQNNDQTGFKNFANYQDRKDDGWDKNPYFWEAVRIAINYRLNYENLSSLEGRMVPKSEPDLNINKVYRYDKAKRFADLKVSETWDRSRYDFDKNLDHGLFKNANWYYIFHFVKLPDEKFEERNKGIAVIKGRNMRAREMANGAAIGIIHSLYSSAYLRNRLHGIDAASDEFHCRPEVFAVAYRYISGKTQAWNAKPAELLPHTKMNIRKTYHVGEDFLDIPDGLRAIDEAIYFLEMEPESRLGHCLAMGVDPNIHYSVKHYEILTTKQDRLDDLVWIIFRSRELGVSIPVALKAYLENEAWELFDEIYGKAVRRNQWNCTLKEYWDSMYLRGDDPSLYVKKIYYPSEKLGNEIDHYLVNHKDLTLKRYQNDERLTGLYHYYHFGKDENKKGREPYTFRVRTEYIELVKQLQEAMMKYVYSKRIIIECNPSSNVLIGTFKHYSEHPLFRFNNRKLNTGQDIQLNVCINTDDLGVFDTSLEFEYALIYETLKEKTDKYGNCLYNDRDIMEYLDDLRKMGLGAVF